MADFRQNVGDVPTVTPNISYSTPKTSSAAILGEGLADAFSAYLKGEENSAAAQYRARADARAEASFQMEEQKFFDQEQERSASNLMAYQQANTAFAQLQDSMVRQGIQFGESTIPLRDLGNNQIQAISTAVDQAGRNQTLLSGGKNSDALAFANARDYFQNVARFPELSYHFAEIFKQNTGKDITAYTQGIMDTQQNTEIHRAEQERKQLDDFRAQWSLPASMTDEQVTGLMLQDAQRKQRAAVLAEAKAKQEYASGQVSLATARRAYAQPVILAAAIRENDSVAAQRFSGLVSMLTGNGTHEVGVVNAQDAEAMIQQFTSERNRAYASILEHGGTPESANAAVATYDDMIRRLPDILNGKVSLERLQNSANIVKAADFSTAIQDPTVRSLILTGQIADAIPDPLLSGAFNSTFATAMAPTGKQFTTIAPTLGRNTPQIPMFGRYSLVDSFGAGLQGQPHPAVTLSPNAPPQERRQADASFGVFAGSMLSGNPNNPANVDLTTTPFSDIQLGGNGRSVNHIPQPLIPKANIDPTIGRRLDALAPSLAQLDWNRDVSRTAQFEELMKIAADPSAAATVYVDPRILRSYRQNAIEYIGRLARGATEDLNAARSANSANPGGYRSRVNGEFFPVPTGGYSTDHGIQTKIDRNGSVSFSVNPNLPTDQAIEASRIANEFNRRYAPRLTQVTRTYAHLFQEDDPFNYDRAFSAVLLGGYTVNPNDAVEAAVNELAGTNEYKNLSRQEIRNLVEGLQSKDNVRTQSSR